MGGGKGKREQHKLSGEVWLEPLNTLRYLSGCREKPSPELSQDDKYINHFGPISPTKPANLPLPYTTSPRFLYTMWYVSWCVFVCVCVCVCVCVLVHDICRPANLEESSWVAPYAAKSKWKRINGRIICPISSFSLTNNYFLNIHILNILFSKRLTTVLGSIYISNMTTCYVLISNGIRLENKLPVSIKLKICFPDITLQSKRKQQTSPTVSHSTCPLSSPLCSDACRYL